MYTQDHAAVASGSLTPRARGRASEKAPRIPAEREVSRKKSGVDVAVDDTTFQMLVSAFYFCSIFILSIVPYTSEYALPFYSVQYTAFVDGRLVSYVGKNDFGVVVSSSMSIIGIRAVCVRFFVAISSRLGIKSAKRIVRFAEQAWCVLHYGAMALIGSLLLFKSSYSWSPHTIWADYPHIYMDVGLKVYYLFELAYWSTQIYIIYAEERRKDHYQMLIHHIITCMLVVGSYYFHYTRIGHLIMIIMDGVDVFLSLAKCLKYIGFEKLCDATFFVFLVGWLTARHGVYIWQLSYAYLKAPALISTNCQWHSFWEQEVCFNQEAHNVFATLLLMLQVITFFWLWMIMKVVIKVVRGGGAEDSRSDDEEDED